MHSTSRAVLEFLGRLFFYLSGLACMIIGIKIVTLDFKMFASFENVNLLHSPAYLLIFLAVIFMVAGVCGCCNVFTESKGCLASVRVF